MDIEIRREPSGEAYQQLITVAAEVCAFFSLVWRDHVRATDELSSQLAHESRATSWPGTQLFGGRTALVRTYRVTAESVAILSLADRLFAWRGPARPEDLGFYTPDAKLWLGSVAHERFAWFDGDAVSIDFVRDRLPLIVV